MTNLFKNIPEKNIDKLLHVLKATTLRYSKNVDVLSNNYMDDFFAIIEEGNIQLIYNDYDGNKTIIEEFHEGEVFGSLISQIQSEEISCITKEKTKITYIEFNQITNNDIIKTDSYIIFIKNLIKILSEQVTNKNNRIELLTKRTTRDKILEYFKMQSQKKGSKTFTLPITYTELANYLSVDRSAMTREIKYLKIEGFIETNGRKISLLY